MLMLPDLSDKKAYRALEDYSYRESYKTKEINPTVRIVLL